MAIQKTKIPTPSEIKNSPTSFNEQELKKIKTLRNDLDRLSYRFGQLAISKIKVEEQETRLKLLLIETEKQESLLAKSLTEKYGKGTIDIETGTFTPTK